MAKVSVVVPVYNVEKYLRECLDSIQNQTLKDMEIICIDDGSTDSSAQILDKYAETDDRFRIVHKSNEGYGKAMNMGMSLARSPYVGIVESDDRIEPDMYEKLYALMEEKQADVIKADFYEFHQGDKGNTIERYISCISESKLSDYIPRNPAVFRKILGLYDTVFDIREHEEAFLFEKYTWSGLYRRKFLEEHHIVHNESPGASYQDNGFWFQTLCKAERIYCTKQAFYHYRIDNMESSIHSKAKVFAVCDEHDFIRGILDEMGEDGKRFYKWSTYFKITDCVASIARVSDEYKEALAERIKKEIILAVNRGEIYVDMFAEHWRNRLFEIMIDQNGYIEKQKKRLQKIDDAVGGYSSIILYGAGIWGLRAYDFLVRERRNIKIKYFAVTHQEGNPESLLGVPVRSIRELGRYKETGLIIIAVGKGYAEEVEKLLKAEKFQNYIFFSELYE